jgi:hypothetical protein
MSKSALLERPAEARAERSVGRERITIARVAVVIAYVLISTAIALSSSAVLVHEQSVALGQVDSNHGAVVDLLTMGGLALLGAVSAGVAAVNQRPKRLSSWVALVASGVALLALLLASLPLT